MKNTFLKQTSFSRKHLTVFILLFALIGSVVLWRSLALNPNLPGDVNNDNVVNITDMSILLSNYGTNYSAADFNSSGLVDITDLSILLSNYGKSFYPPPPLPPPPPSGTYFTWNRVSDIPDLRDGNNGRLSDTTLSTMPAGISTVIKVSVSGASDSSGGGDGSYATTGNLNEPWITEGSDSWHSMWIAIPDGTNAQFPGKWTHSVISSGWNTFMEFHEPAIAPRSIHFGVWGSDPPVWQMSSAGGSTSSPTDVWVRDTQPIVYNKWQRHVFHVHWSKDKLGYIEWWIDGRQIVSRTSTNIVSSWGGPAIADNYPTAWNYNGAFKAPYFQAGHYRGPSRTDIDTTYMAQVISGPTRTSVGF